MGVDFQYVPNLLDRHLKAWGGNGLPFQVETQGFSGPSMMQHGLPFELTSRSNGDATMWPSFQSTSKRGHDDIDEDLSTRTKRIRVSQPDTSVDEISQPTTTPPSQFNAVSSTAAQMQLVAYAPPVATIEPPKPNVRSLLQPEMPAYSIPRTFEIALPKPSEPPMTGYELVLYRPPPTLDDMIEEHVRKTQESAQSYDTDMAMD
jgi:hypothetical protein